MDVQLFVSKPETQRNLVKKGETFMWVCIFMAVALLTGNEELWSHGYGTAAAAIKRDLPTNFAEILTHDFFCLVGISLKYYKWLGQL